MLSCQGYTRVNKLHHLSGIYDKSDLPRARKTHILYTKGLLENISDNKQKLTKEKLDHDMVLLEQAIHAAENGLTNSIFDDTSGFCADIITQFSTVIDDEQKLAQIYEYVKNNFTLSDEEHSIFDQWLKPEC